MSTLFAIYITDSILKLVNADLGFNIANCLLYADDIVLFSSPSVDAQLML